ncbi:unnamed protein product [marine sediment metagenome]|uniref:Uncharacterized protein n=1 Tax=marine sediment metagenome TaxID=412755 RepID=X0T4J1_9ZZZZ
MAKKKEKDWIKDYYGSHKVELNYLLVGYGIGVVLGGLPILIGLIIFVVYLFSKKKGGGD